MADTGKSDPLRLGFFASIAVPDRGFVGGLLVTNHLGRPLEFQCTAPVKPNRTQEILYGPTLVPFLLGEVIGRTLVEKVGVKPLLLLVDDAELLNLRSHIDLPVGWVNVDSDGKVTRSGAASESGPTLTIGRQEVRFSADHASDRERLKGSAVSVPKEADLSEPFTRVREALQETLQAGAAA